MNKKRNNSSRMHGAGAAVPRRVLMSADTIGGVWTYAIDLTRELSAFGVEVYLATMGKRLSPDQASEASRIRNLSVFESTLKLEWMDDPWRDVDAAGEWLLELERQIRPDVVHLNGFAHGSLATRAPRLVVGHSCVLSWWQAVKGEPAPKAWDTYRSRASRGLRSADFVLAPTRSMLCSMVDHYGKPTRTRVIPNGRSAERFAPAKNEKIILMVGRLWDEAKNVRAVIDAARELNYEFIVAGDTLSAATGEHGPTAPSNVSFAGHLAHQQVADLYARASVYSHPAKYEPFGLSVLEAAMSGCSLVLGDIPSLRENWNGAALFVEPDDPAQLASCIDRLMKDASLRKQMAGEAMRRASRFTADKMACEYYSLYCELMNGRVRSHVAREETVCVL